MSKKFDLQFKNKYGALPEGFYTKMRVERFAKKPFLIHVNKEVAKLLDLKFSDWKRANFPLYFSGNFNFMESDPLAMAYSGHQFGHFAGQLGDGRALLLGQVENKKGELWDIHIKGSGKTPYSRFGDGRAVLRSCIREYLASEAMFALGIPTTRALCVIGTNEIVMREKPEPGAILTRLAQSHIRFGNFEHFYYRQEYHKVRILADYVIKNHFPEVKNYHEFFAQVVIKTARLIASWQAVGFCHGVMNTDNMSIIGLTFDYGPFGFMENFNPHHICNHSDTTGRYAYDMQPSIGLWNLYALAHALNPLISAQESGEILKTYEPELNNYYKKLMCKKIGLIDDKKLWPDLMKLIEQNQSDYSLSFRYLSDSFKNPNKWLDLFKDKEAANNWLNSYHSRVKFKNLSLELLAIRLNKINPKYILRNWIAELAIREAQDKNNYQMLDNILKIVQKPFDEHEDFNYLSQPAPEAFKNLYISCSS